MKKTTGKPARTKTVAEYPAARPTDKRATLATIRKTIKAAAPDAVEGIAYGIVGYKYKGRPLIYFGYGKDHCALYGGWVQDYADELKKYVASKGTLRFSADKPMPTRLVTKIVKARVAQIDRIR